MATRVLVGTVKDRKANVGAAVFYDSVTMIAFGPVITLESAVSNDEVLEFAEDFCEYIEKETGRDPRLVPTKRLYTLLVEFMNERATEAADSEVQDDSKKGGAVA